MKSKTSVAALCAVVMAAVPSSPAAAQERADCQARVTRSNVVQCALAASLVVRGEQQELVAARARKTAASPLLPSNPTLLVSAARRNSATQEATNWYASLNQEVEIAGQRGVRRDAAEAGITAQSQRVLLSRRETAAAASTAFFEALAARDEQNLADRLTVTADAVAVAARARADRGLIATVDADVADAVAVKVLQAKLAAARRLAVANADLSVLLGLDAARAPAVEGELAPLSEVVVALATRGANPVGARPELLALEAERRASSLRADAFRRSRIPNPTLSLLAQSDGFQERVLGAGIAFPLPLPGNVGRTYRGEIAEAEAVAARAATDRDRTARKLRADVATTAQAFTSRTEEVAAFSADRIARAEASLTSLGEEVKAGRLAARDAAIAQQALIELLRANVEARRAWCLASVDLALALNLPLEKVSP